MLYVLCLAMGAIAGLRAMTPMAAIGWAVHLGILSVSGTWLAFLGKPWLPWLLTALALIELVTDQLPSTPSRTVPSQFGARILTGAVAGAAIGMAAGNFIVGAVCGVVGAVFGTLGGRAARARLAAAFGRDLPAALIEDAVALLGAYAVVSALS